MCFTQAKVIKTHSVVSTHVLCKISVTLDLLRLKQCVDFSVERKTNVGLAGMITFKDF